MSAGIAALAACLVVTVLIVCVTVFSKRKKRRSHVSPNRPKAAVAVTCSDSQTTGISMNGGVASGTDNSVDCRDNPSYATALNDDSDLNEEYKANAAYGLSIVTDEEHQYEFIDTSAQAEEEEDSIYY